MAKETRRHAVLAPSSASRWLTCTPSARLEEQEPDEGSEFAREGTLAHAMAAVELRRALRDIRPQTPTYETDTTEAEAEIAELREVYHTGEMEEAVDEYVMTVLERYHEARQRDANALLRVEKRVDMTEWVEECTGTSDAIIIAGNQMEVIDLKYGKGVRVSAEGNRQMMLYALGAYTLYGVDYGIETVRMTVAQPRLGALSTWETTADELLAWAQTELKELAELAWKGAGYLEAGEHCRFCRVKGKCPRLAVVALKDVAKSPQPSLMTPSQVAGALRRLDLVKTWVKAVEEHALMAALDGTEIPGYKVVEGRSVRKVTNVFGAMGALREAGYDSSQFTRPVELRTITELEKLCGKKRFAELCGAYITKPEGKPTLVPESDRRRARTAADDFAKFDV